MQFVLDEQAERDPLISVSYRLLFDLQQSEDNLQHVMP
jgi:hypothetical protein